tara:strand:+ start:191 stop:475 length:285 start_codon:yes stop_codon:yes gene_type:complete
MNQKEFINNLIGAVENAPIETVLSNRAITYYGKDLDNPVMLIVFYDGHRDVTLYTKETEFTVTQEDRGNWATLEYDMVTDYYLHVLKEKVESNL